MDAIGITKWLLIGGGICSLYITFLIGLMIVFIIRKINREKEYDTKGTLYRQTFDQRLKSIEATERKGLLYLVVDKYNPPLNPIPFYGWSDKGEWLEISVDTSKGFLDLIKAPLHKILIVPSDCVKSRHFETLVVLANGLESFGNNILYPIPWYSNGLQIRNNEEKVHHAINTWTSGTRYLMHHISPIENQKKVYNFDNFDPRTIVKELLEFTRSPLVDKEESQ